ncbi:hypothetical protein L6164_031141 [Bauhinia variegata]|uniref:Uncharacterized protein n=1 Tax=Bauhinia variegata TaxID=167791 RepID=A0ACB9LF09_BAUVA|nr:hypothetical protein L6164_031141 [Bauhinia variegata]
MACLGFRIQTKTRLLYSTFVNPIQEAKFVLPQTLAVSMTQGKSKRPICPSCSKPVRTCLCSRILTRGIENLVSVTILQHALESKHPLNSTRIAKLGLKNLRVATVSDVLFEAQFMIRLMEPNLESGFVRDGSGSLVSGHCGRVSENGETQKSVDETELCSKCYREGDSNLNGSGESCSGRNDIRAIQSSQISVGVHHVANSDSKLNLSDGVVVSDKAVATDEKYPLDPTKGFYEDNGGPAITSTIGKYGCIRSLSHIWNVSQTQTQKPSFRKILACPDAHEALSKGFLVRRLQRKQLNGNIDLEEDEFELEVPSGSVLLFPSDKAVDVGDLVAHCFKVKNLIVLDGTWAKARRIYSENPWLEILPHLKLEVNKMSLYSEVRHQPKAGYLSTIESIVYALRAVGENHEGLDNLLDAFESMVGDQRRCKNERLRQSE